MKKQLCILFALIFLFANQAWAVRTFYAPMTSNATATVLGGTATINVDGPDGWYTWIDTDGVLQGTSAQASPSARIEADGLLCEGMGVNLNSYSLMTSTWDTTRSIKSTGQTDPAGGSNAIALLADDSDADATHIFHSAALITIDDNTTVTFSIFAKKKDYDWIQLRIRKNDAGQVFSYFNLSTGALGTNSGCDNRGISALGSTGWYRIWITEDVSATGNQTRFDIYIVNADDDANFDVTGTNVDTTGTYIYGAQVEESPYPTSYIPTSGATAVRWSQEGAVDTTELLGTTNTTSFKLSAASGNSFFQSDDITLTDYAGVLGTDLINASTLNGDMEDNSNWTTTGTPSTCEQSTTKVWEGSYSWYVDADALNEGIYSDTFVIPADTSKYWITFNYYIVSGELDARSKNPTDSKGLDFTGTYTTTGSWQKATIVTTATGTLEYERIYFRSNGGAAEFYIDDVRISPITTTSPAYRITLTDDSSETLVGFIGYPDVAETVGLNIVADETFDDITKAAAKGVDGITKANPGVVTFDAGHGYSDGDVIYFSGLTEMTELNGEYWILRSNAGDTFELQTTVGSSLDTSGYGAAETTGGNCAQLCDFTEWTEGTGWHPGVDGAGALSGVAHCDGSQGGNTDLTDASGSDDYYYEQYQFTVSDYSAGAVKMYPNGISSSGDKIEDGTYTQYTNMRQTLGTILLRGNATFVGSVDNAIIQYVRHAGTDGVRVYTDENLDTEGWDDDGDDFDFTDTEYDVTIEFIDTNGIYWAHADLWATNWATDMDPEGTMSLEWTPGFSNADLAAGNWGGISPTNVSARLFYFTREGTGTLVSNDSSNVCKNEAGITSGTTIDVVVTWDDDIDAQGDLEVYADGTASGDLEEYDGAWPTGTNLIIGFNNPYPFHVKSLRFSDTYYTGSTTEGPTSLGMGMTMD